MVLNDDFVSCILEDFTNEMALSFDVISIFLSVYVGRINEKNSIARKMTYA